MATPPSDHLNDHLFIDDDRRQTHVNNKHQTLFEISTIHNLSQNTKHTKTKFPQTIHPSIEKILSLLSSLLLFGFCVDLGFGFSSSFIGRIEDHSRPQKKDSTQRGGGGKKAAHGGKALPHTHIPKTRQEGKKKKKALALSRISGMIKINKNEKHGVHMYVCVCIERGGGASERK